MPPTSQAERPRFLRLFLYPFLIVAIAVGGVAIFTAGTEDRRSAEQVLAEIQTGGGHRRSQDAYTLAHLARAKAERGEHFTESVTRQLLALVEKEAKGGDPELLRVLTLAAGRAGRPETTVPVMARLALNEDSPPAARFQAVWALGISGTQEAVEPLLEVLDQHVGPESWEFRWNALAGLANLKSPAAVPPLREALKDPRRELRWSAACWLATTFGEDAGRALLEKLTGWDFLDEQVGDGERKLTREEKENYMLIALDGIVRLEGLKARELLERKTREKRSPKVRNQAIKLLEQLASAEEN